MDTEHIRFYKNKSKLLLCILACAIFIVGGYFMIIDEKGTLSDKLVGYSAILFFGLGVIVFCFSLFSKKAYIEITPTYIKIGNFDRLLWKDITYLNATIHKSTAFLSLEVKDLSKYKLTFVQKLNLYTGFSPFFITPSILSKQDYEQLKTILRQRIPQNDFEYEDEIMRTSCYKFHRKYKLPLFILGSIISTIPLFYYLTVNFYNSTYIYNSTYTRIQTCGICLYIPCVILFSFILYTIKSYIKITLADIKIDNSDELFWEDIICLRTLIINSSVFWSLEVKDLSKYHLTSSQKNNLKLGFSPFMIAPSYLTKHDREQLKNILKLHIPQNDLD